MKIAKDNLNSRGGRFALNFHRNQTPSSQFIRTDTSLTPIIFGQIGVHFITGKHALDCLLFFREVEMDGQELIAGKDLSYENTLLSMRLVVLYQGSQLLIF